MQSGDKSLLEYLDNIEQKLDASKTPISLSKVVGVSFETIMGIYTGGAGVPYEVYESMYIGMLVALIICLISNAIIGALTIRLVLQGNKNLAIGILSLLFVGLIPGICYLCWDGK